MKLAWAASIATQGILAATRYRAGQRDWWTLYLALEAARSLLLFLMAQPVHSHNFWWAWVITQLATTYPGVRMVQQASGAGPSQFLGIGMAAGMLSWAIVLTHPDWPVYRRAGLMLHQCLAFGGFGVMCAAAADGIKRPAILAYFSIESLEVLAEQIARTRVWVDLVGIVYLVTLSVFFSALILHERSMNYAGE